MLWIPTVALLAVSLHVTILNGWCAIRGLLGRSTSSWIPLLGGVAGAAGCLLAPGGALRPFWWVPLLVDFGSLPGLTWTLLAQLFARGDE